MNKREFLNSLYVLFGGAAGFAIAYETLGMDVPPHSTREKFRPQIPLKDIKNYSLIIPGVELTLEKDIPGGELEQALSQAANALGCKLDIENVYSYNQTPKPEPRYDFTRVTVSKKNEKIHLGYILGSESEKLPVAPGNATNKLKFYGTISSPPSAGKDLLNAYTLSYLNAVSQNLK